jgi:hypothetical protein
MENLVQTAPCVGVAHEVLCVLAQTELARFPTMVYRELACRLVICCA